MDSNQNKYTTIYGKSEVIFQDKFKETILTTQSYIDRAGKSITNPPMNYVQCRLLQGSKSRKSRTMEEKKEDFITTQILNIDDKEGMSNTFCFKL